MSKPPSKYTTDFSRYMRGFDSSMRQRGLVKFMHDITFGHGEISMLMSDVEIFRCYYDHKIPVVCTNASGRTLNSGLYINQFLEKKYLECSVLMKVLRNIAQKFYLNYGKNSLHYVVKEEHCQHLYSIFFDLSDDDFIHFVINNGSLIQDMVDEYNFVAKDIIVEAKAVENRIILPSASDFLLFQENTSNVERSDQISVIHKNTGLPMHLTAQRGQCLLHLVQGKSTKEIARDMNLSPKTVEHYLELLRKELGCRSSKELIIFYASQFAS